MNADETRQTAEMWFWRRTLKVHWTTRVKKYEMPRRRIAERERDADDHRKQTTTILRAYCEKG